jgi:hypothetical protein
MLGITAQDTPDRVVHPRAADGQWEGDGLWRQGSAVTETR